MLPKKQGVKLTPIVCSGQLLVGGCLHFQLWLVAAGSQPTSMRESAIAQVWLANFRSKTHLTFMEVTASCYVKDAARTTSCPIALLHVVGVVQHNNS